MKYKLNSLNLLALVIFMLALNGCKTNNMMHCPDFASAKRQHAPLFAFNHLHHNKASKPVQAASSAPADSLHHADMLAANEEMHFKIKMPSALMQNVQSEQELADMNKVLATYSANKVTLQRNSNGKLYLKAHKLKDILTLSKNAQKAARGGDGSGSAIAAVVLGPLSFVFAFIPFLSLLAIPMSIAAIITGSIGLRSSRRGLATIGLVFGILALVISIIFSILYFVVFSIV